MALRSCIDYFGLIGDDTENHVKPGNKTRRIKEACCEICCEILLTVIFIHKGPVQFRLSQGSGLIFSRQEFSPYWVDWLCLDERRRGGEEEKMRGGEEERRGGEERGSEDTQGQSRLKAFLNIFISLQCRSPGGIPMAIRFAALRSLCLSPWRREASWKEEA